MISQPHEMFGTCMYLSISTRVLQSEGDTNLTRVHIVFQTRCDPHSHGVFGVCGSVSATRPVLCVWCALLDLFSLLCKMPGHIEHLNNFKLYLHDMLITRHSCYLVCRLLLEKK